MKFKKYSIIFSVGIWAIVLLQELLLRFFIPRTMIMTSDVIDFLFVAFFLVLFYLFYKSLEIKKIEKKWLVVLAISLVIFIEGHAIHFVANSIHNFMDSLKLKTGDLYALVNFYDEVAGHILINIGLLGVFIGGLFLHIKNPVENVSKKDSLIIIIMGFFAGLVHGMSLLEGQLGAVAFALIPLLILFSFFITKNIKKIKLPFLLFSLSLFGATFLMILLWFSFTGSFKEPSKLQFLKPLGDKHLQLKQ